MWSIECFFIPATIRATGIVTRGLKKSGNNTRKAFKKFSTKKKTAAVGTSHIIRKVLTSET
jgi:hypothetical protein